MNFTNWTSEQKKKTLHFSFAVVINSKIFVGKFHLLIYLIYSVRICINEFIAKIHQAKLRLQKSIDGTESFIVIIITIQSVQKAPTEKITTKDVQNSSECNHLRIKKTIEMIE